MGALLGGSLGLAGGLASAAASFALQEDAQKFAKGMYKHRYRYTMDDMRKAGLNPILAYSQGVGGGVSAPMGNAPDMATAMSSGAESGARRGKISTEKDLIRQQTSTSAAQAADATAGAALKTAQARLTTAQAKKAEVMSPFYGFAGEATKQLKQLPDLLRPLGPGESGRNLLKDMFFNWGKEGRNYQGYKNRDFYKKRRTEPR